MFSVYIQALCICIYCNHGEFAGIYGTNRPMTSVALEIHTLDSSLVKSWSTSVAQGIALGLSQGKYLVLHLVYNLHCSSSRVKAWVVTTECVLNTVQMQEL